MLDLKKFKERTRAALTAVNISDEDRKKLLMDIIHNLIDEIVIADEQKHEQELNF